MRISHGLQTSCLHLSYSIIISSCHETVFPRFARPPRHNMEAIQRLLSKLPTAKPHRTNQDDPIQCDTQGHLEFAGNDVDNPKNVCLPFPIPVWIF